MTAPALRPRSSTEIVDASFQILRAHYLQFVMCSALAYAPWLILQVLIVSNPTLATSFGVGVSVLLVLGVWFAFALMSAVTVVCASQAYLGEPVDVGTAIRRALPRLPRVLLAATLRYLLMGLGAFLFLVGMFYVWARFFAVTPLIVLEESSVGESFSRSSALSQGRKWHILVAMGLVILIYWVLAIGVQVLVNILTTNLIVQTVIAAFITILVYPVIGITEALVYYDARIKSEGLDIELMAGALEGPSAAPITPS
jgi:hypothetical protein